MAKIISSFIIIAFLSGCSLLPERVVYKQVKVPVASCPATQIPPRPDLDIFALTDKSSDGEIVRAYVTSIAKLQNQIIILETLLNRYNTLNDNLNSTKNTP